MGGAAFIDGIEYNEFDNFFPCKIPYDSFMYLSSEHCFQAQKNDSIDYKAYICLLKTPALAREAGQKINLRKDWEEIKSNVMFDTNLTKILYNEDLMYKLCTTTGKIIFKRSSDYWNKVNSENLERIRLICRNFL